VLSLDLLGTGIMGCRVGKTLRIPSSVWVFGKIAHRFSGVKNIARALKQFDVVFYQSREAFVNASQLLNMTPEALAVNGHKVLPHGIVKPPRLAKNDIRTRLLREWGFSQDAVLAMSVGRLTHEKGTFELLESLKVACAQDPRLVCVVVGSLPAFDETHKIENYINHAASLKNRVKIMPACRPDMVWEYLCAADIFLFASHHEGMPNSLLEAMAMGLPAVAFAIPPVQELDGGKNALATVPPFEVGKFAATILGLANNPGERRRMGERARDRVMEDFLVTKNMARAVAVLSGVRPRVHGATIAGA
jgi:glycosyltransferase involved in cell wall biosynthesis